MKNNIVKNTVSFFIMFLFIACYTVYGTEDFSQLSLHISTDLTETLPMEPLPVTISLSNNTNSSIWAFPVISPNAGFLDIFIRSENGEFKLFPTADWPLASVVSKEVELKPGYKRQVSGFLYFAQPAAPRGFNPDNFSKQHLLPAPGTYHIKVILKSMDGPSKQSKIESNIITIHVKQPTGEDALAYEYMKNIRKPYFLMRTFGKYWDEEDQQIISAMEDFLKQFPASRYACYVNYSLGHTYVTKSGDYLNSGIEKLEQAADHEDFFLAGKALSRLVEISLKSDNLDKAQYYHNMLKTRFPDSSETKGTASKISKVLSDTKK